MFGVFLLISITVFIVLMLLMRQIKKQNLLSKDKLTTLGMILFVPALVIFALIFKSLANWRADIRETQEQARIETFIAEVYQPLASARHALRKNLIETQQLIKEVEVLEQKHPNQLALLRLVRQQWTLGHKALYKAYTDTDKEVRYAWIVHNKLDKKDVLAKFSKQAVQLETRIKNAQSDYDKHLFSVQGNMVTTLDRVRKLLDAKRKPPRSKQQMNANAALEASIKPVDNSIEQELRRLVGTLDSRLEEDMLILHELSRVAGQQTAVIKEHLYKNRDLELPLTKIINDWKALEIQNNTNLRLLYFAIEAEYIVRSLGLSVDNPAVKAMHQSLVKTIPTLKGTALRQKKRIDQSYSINLGGS